MPPLTIYYLICYMLQTPSIQQQNISQYFSLIWMAPGAQKLLICYHHFPVLARHTYLLLKNLIRIFLNGDNLRWTLISLQVNKLFLPGEKTPSYKQPIQNPFLRHKATNTENLKVKEVVIKMEDVIAVIFYYDNVLLQSTIRCRMD